MGRNWQWSFDHGREQRLKLERGRRAGYRRVRCPDRPCRSIAMTAPCNPSSPGLALGHPAEVYESRNKHRFKILTTGNSKVAEHCARLRALFRSRQ